MRLVIQRVKEASVKVEGELVGRISHGLLVFLGVSKEDTVKDADRLVTKLVELRIFDDAKGKMDLSALDLSVQVLVVSQFTLYGSCLKGRRPSFDEAASPDRAEELYDYFIQALRRTGLTVATGRFRAMMEVSLINDGPVTFILESNAHH